MAGDGVELGSSTKRFRRRSITGMLAAANTAADGESPTDRAAEASAAPPQASKSGWGVDTVRADTTASSVNEPRQRRGNSEAEEPRGPDRSRHNADLEDAVQEIASLDVEDTEDAGSQVSAPPRQSGVRVQTIRELDRSAHYSLPSASDTGVDLSLLTSVLCPPSQVAEEDTIWTAESLLSELQLEANAATDGNATPEREEKPAADVTPATSRGENGRMNLAAASVR